MPAKKLTPKASRKSTKKAPKSHQNDTGSAPRNSGRLRLEYVQAKTLTPNPLNWRKHPKDQLKALGGVLRDAEVGWAGALLFNERTGRLIDGHGRLKVVKPHEFVPVLIGSWSEAAEKKILLTLDPLAGMADVDTELLADLRIDVGELDASFAGLDEELNRLLRPEGDDDDNDKSERSYGGGGGPGGGGSPPPSEPDKQFKIIIDCRDEAHQAELIERFTEMELKFTAPSM